MATHSSILAWKIPWTEEPGKLQSIGWQKSDTTEATEHTHTQGNLCVTFWESVRLFSKVAVLCYNLPSSVERSNLSISSPTLVIISLFYSGICIAKDGYFCQLQD